ncbi:MAG TPA: GNAT family N-acetyltransferase [Candidatus Limnocylindrales bacterium]
MTFRPMSPEEWDVWAARANAAHVEEMVGLGRWPVEGAEARSAKEFEGLLPAGQATPGHAFLWIVRDDGQTVGSVWVGADAEIGAGALFIWDLLIQAEFRGQGLGRATMAALEPFARGLGYSSIRLHVFGSNEVARNLYRSSGYLETDVTMLKQV